MQSNADFWRYQLIQFQSKFSLGTPNAQRNIQTNKKMYALVVIVMY